MRSKEDAVPRQHVVPRQAEHRRRCGQTILPFAPDRAGPELTISVAAPQRDLACLPRSLSSHHPEKDQDAKRGSDKAGPTGKSRDGEHHRKRVPGALGVCS